MKLRICCEELKEMADENLLYYSHYEGDDEEVVHTLALTTPIGLDTIAVLNFCPSCGEPVRFYEEMPEDWGTVMIGYSGHKYIFGDEHDGVAKHLGVIRYLDDEDKSGVFFLDDPEVMQEKTIRPYGLTFKGFNHIPFEVFKEGVKVDGTLAGFYVERELTSISVDMFAYFPNLDGERIDVKDLRR